MANKKFSEVTPLSPALSSDLIPAERPGDSTAYSLSVNTLTSFIVAYIVANPSVITEIIQDITGAMVIGNTETGIDVTYDDATGKLNFTVTASGLGDVSGPASAVDSQIAVFDGTTGKVLKDGGTTVASLATVSVLNGKFSTSTGHDHDGSDSKYVEKLKNTAGGILTADMLTEIPPYTSYTFGTAYTRYYGESASTSLNESGVTGLAHNESSPEFAGFFSFNSGATYKYLAYRQSIGTAVSFVDINTGLPVPFESPSTVSVSGVAYNVHRSTNILNSAIDIMVY